MADTRTNTEKVSNTNRDLLMQVDVKSSSLTGGDFTFYVTDKNTSNFFVKLVINMSTNPNIARYVALENASDYKLFLKCKKPNGQLLSLEGTLMDEEEALFQYNLTEDQKDVVGIYLCEYWITSMVNGEEEVITTAPFKFTVAPSIINSLDNVVEDPQQYPIYQDVLNRLEVVEQLDFATEDYVDEAVANIDVTDQLSTKVDKETGKGLSTNDYTTAEKNKLAGIEAGANKVTVYTASQCTTFTSDDGTCTPLAVQKAVGMFPPKAHEHSQYLTQHQDISGKADITYVDDELAIRDRFHTALYPTGTSIPANADLNTLDYIKVGSYYCGANATAKTLTNCPIAVAFMMEVISPLASTYDDEQTRNWVYRLRRITQFNTGVQYLQLVSSSATAGEFTYGDWKKTALSNEITTAINSHATSYYTKTQVDNLLPTKVSQLENDNGFITISHEHAKPQPGNFFVNGYAGMTDDGVMECGKYQDWHNTDEETIDYSLRVQLDHSNANTVLWPTASGRLALQSDIDSKITAHANSSRITYRMGVGSTDRYYPLFKLEADGSSNYGNIILKGRIGGWEQSNSAVYDITLLNRSSARDGRTITAMVSMQGDHTQSYQRADIVIYRQDDTSAMVYLKANGYVLWDFEYMLYQHTRIYDESYITTVPTGELVWQLSTAPKTHLSSTGTFSVGTSPTTLKEIATKQVKTFTLPATAGWYRIAEAPVGNVAGRVKLKAVNGSYACASILDASITNNKYPSLVPIVHSIYSSTYLSITQARIVYVSGSSTEKSYLEVYVSVNVALTMTVETRDSEDWQLIDPVAIETSPSGYNLFASSMQYNVNGYSKINHSHYSVSAMSFDSDGYLSITIDGVTKRFAPV